MAVTKTCRRCKQDKPLEAFSLNRNGTHGRNTTCRTCACEVTAAWHAANPGARHRQKLAKYGLTPESYAELLDAQGGVCAICERPPPGERMLAVDHDHDTGEVRGLLCSNCNTALGLLGDNAASLLVVMVNYLARAGSYA